MPRLTLLHRSETRLHTPAMHYSNFGSTPSRKWQSGSTRSRCNVAIGSKRRAHLLSTSCIVRQEFRGCGVGCEALCGQKLQQRAAASAPNLRRAAQSVGAIACRARSARRARLCIEAGRALSVILCAGIRHATLGIGAAARRAENVRIGGIVLTARTPKASGCERRTTRWGATLQITVENLPTRASRRAGR